MLKHTFCHLPGITPQEEEALWQDGIHTWNDLSACSPSTFTSFRHSACCRAIETSMEHLDEGNPKFFYQVLPSCEHWRLFPTFREQTAYLDIETTGLSHEWDDITTIAVYDGQHVKSYVKGINLQEFRKDIVRFKQIVTYNGKTFDAPFLRTKLHVALDQGHLDLRYILKRLGYGGGLKKVEKKLGIKRKGMEEVDGKMAVYLWEDYRKGNERALETLLAYNMTDAVNLETLMVLAFNKALKQTPFKKELGLSRPEQPVIPYKPDGRTIRKLQFS